MGRRPSVALLRDITTLFETGAARGTYRSRIARTVCERARRQGRVGFRGDCASARADGAGVCQNLLADSNDVHDAFQATFLVLVRRRGSVRTLNSLGGWLYGVASRVAVRARVDAARRRSAEQRAALRVVEAFEPTDVVDQDREGCGAIVQEEVRRLPERYRAVVVLCYWEGLTQEQASVQLGCPLGTVRSRLARARNLLRRRLIRRGLAPLGEVVAVGLNRVPVTTVTTVPHLSPVPSALASSTCRAAAQIAAGQIPVKVASAGAASLLQHVYWGITMIKIKTAVTGFVLFALVSSCGWLAAHKGSIALAQHKGPPKTALPNENATRAPESKVRSAVPRETTVIKKLASDGERVKKGDVVCELDSAALNNQLINQRITEKSAEANFGNARLARESAEVDLAQYEEGPFKLELMEVVRDRKVAEAELALAEDQLELARSARGAPRPRRTRKREPLK